jgi:phosphoribosylformylglycinamidine synthase
VDASNGASDYGNKFGEPLVAGYTRTFGQRLPGGERREWIKPIMFRCVRGYLCVRACCVCFVGGGGASSL